MTSNARDYGDLIPFRLGLHEFIQLNHPDLIKYVLLDNHKNYRKSDTHIRFKEVFGDGILVSNGKKWKRDRQMLQPAFKKDYIEGIYFQAVIDAVKKTQETWSKAARDQEPVNITKDMSTITLQVILWTMFGANISEEELQKIDQAIHTFLWYTGMPRLISSMDLRRWYNPAGFYEVIKHRAYLVGFIKSVYEREKQAPSKRRNMMQMMIEAEAETGQKFSFEDICDQSMTMILGGYETTSAMLQWAWYCLDQYPEQEQIIREELKTVNAEQPDFSSISQLGHLDAFLKEVIRAYPPFWGTGRTALEGDVIGGHSIKKGTSLFLSQYAMHHHPKFWNRPEKFDPQRFYPEQEGQIPVGLYFPFSLGPRKCIGYRFAEMEAKTALVMLLSQFSLSVVDGQNTRIKPIISLRFQDDLMMTIQQAS